MPFTSVWVLPAASAITGGRCGEVVAYRTPVRCVPVNLSGRTTVGVFPITRLRRGEECYSRSITADGSIRSPFVPSVARGVGKMGASLTPAISQNTSVSVVPL